MKLLLAEDEVDLSRALTEILKHNNYIVDAVYDGQKALDYILENEYDGIILDIMMPKMDGLTVLKKMRSSGNNTPVIMLTAKAEIEDRVKGLDEGADDYLTKPFSSKELLARIRAMTRRKRDVIHNNLEYGNIYLDMFSFEMCCGEKKIKLANKEYQMLEMLINNHDRLISTEQFMNKIWGHNSDAEINVVWVYISYLRKKLSDIGANVQIKASRGLGYSLEENND